MKIQPVTSNKELNAFISLPYRIYRHHPDWVPGAN